MYLNTEAPITSVVLLHQNDRFWALLSDTFSQILSQFLSTVAGRSVPFSRVRTDSLISPRNSNITQMNPQLPHMTVDKGKGKTKEGEGEKREEIYAPLELRDFVFSSIIPLLGNFCSRHFTVTGETKEYVLIYFKCWLLTVCCRQHLNTIIRLWEQLRALEGWVTGINLNHYKTE